MMYFIILATALILQAVSAQECRQELVTVCNETPRAMIKGDKGDTGFAGKAGPEGRKGVAGSSGLKGDKGLQGEACALDSFQPVLSRLRAELETLLPPASCQQSTINGKVTLRSGQEVVCDDGWLMFQRIYDSYSLDFNVPWIQYKEGFGDLRQDFWFGLENVYELTKHRGCRLRVDLWNTNDAYSFAEYSDFYIDNESDNYRLHVTGYSGTAGDGLDGHNNQAFTTKDRDNDRFPSNCATHSTTMSGWWYHSSCYGSSLNGAANYGGDPRWNNRYSKATMKVRCD